MDERGESLFKNIPGIDGRAEVPADSSTPVYIHDLHELDTLVAGALVQVSRAQARQIGKVFLRFSVHDIEKDRAVFSSSMAFIVHDFPLTFVGKRSVVIFPNEPSREGVPAEAYVLRRTRIEKFPADNDPRFSVDPEKRKVSYIGPDQWRSETSFPHIVDSDKPPGYKLVFMRPIDDYYYIPVASLDQSVANGGQSE